MNPAKSGYNKINPAKSGYMGKSAKSGPPRAATKRIPLRAVTKMKPAAGGYMVKTAKSGPLREVTTETTSPRCCRLITC